MDSLAPAQVIDHLLHVLVERRQDDVGNQTLVACLHQPRGNPRRDRQRGVLRTKHPVELCLGQLGGNRTQCVGPPEHVLDGVREYPGPADHMVEKDRVAAEMYRGTACQVPRLVDQAAP